MVYFAPTESEPIQWLTGSIQAVLLSDLVAARGLRVVPALIFYATRSDNTASMWYNLFVVRNGKAATERRGQKMMKHQQTEGLPETLREQIEILSDYSMEDAREWAESDMALNWSDYDAESKCEFRRKLRDAVANARYNPSEQ